jgi:hypothetical protein
MKTPKTQNERKSLRDRSLLYINNNSSFHHICVCAPVYTRARESPDEVLRDCWIGFEVVQSDGLDAPTIATSWPQIGRLTRSEREDGLHAPPKRSARHEASQGPLRASAKLADRGRAVRYFRADLFFLGAAENAPKLEKVLFQGPKVNRDVE